MTYISAQPYITDTWDDICFPVGPVWLNEILPDYDIMATDRQQLIVGQPSGGKKTIFGIQSADYAIIPNELIREVIDKLIPAYDLQIKYTSTGEFSVSIIFADHLSVGKEELRRSLILTNSYNGKTPFSIQGQTLPAMIDPKTQPLSSTYRSLCKNGLVGWADSFGKLTNYTSWLGKGGSKSNKAATNAKSKENTASGKQSTVPKIAHSRLSPTLFQEQLYQILVTQLDIKPSLTTTVYQHLQEKNVSKGDESLLKSLPIPVQLAKQAHERLRFEQRILGGDTSYWLLYNAVNHALFNARSSLTLNDRYKLDEKVFHQLAAQSFA